MRKNKKVTVGLLLPISLFITAFAVWPNQIKFFLFSLWAEWTPYAIRFSVKSTDDDRPVFIFDQFSIDYGRHPFYIIDVFELVPSKPDDMKVVWAIQEREGEPWTKSLKSLTYGVCPPGFKQNLAPKPLMIGHYYNFNGIGTIRKNGPRQFEFISRNQYYDGVRKGFYKDAQ
jgi:hypothetical protein